MTSVRGKLFWETSFWADTPAVASRMQRPPSPKSPLAKLFARRSCSIWPAAKRAFDFAMRPLVGSSGEDAFIFFEAIEMTERRLAEEQLRQAQKMESLGQLTGGIAHDFNNLLTGITGSLDLIRRRMVARIARKASSASWTRRSRPRSARQSLTHRLLAFARRQSLDTKPTDVERARARARGPAAPHARRVDPVCAPNWPTTLWPALSDANQLETALVNLAINSRDAMPDGGHLTIATANVTRTAIDGRAAKTLPSGDFVAIRVSDTGSGMSPAVIAKAFDPFFTTKPIGQGTGLGLSMVYGFLKQSGGFVEIDSEVGHGTAVTLFLPRAPHGMRHGRRQRSRAACRAGKARPCCVVEDDASVRLLMTEVLEELGYRYLQAEDGRVAIPILRVGRRDRPARHRCRPSAYQRPPACRNRAAEPAGSQGAVRHRLCGRRDACAAASSRRAWR